MQKSSTVRPPLDDWTDCGARKCCSLPGRPIHELPNKATDRASGTPGHVVQGWKSALETHLHSLKQVVQIEQQLCLGRRCERGNAPQSDIHSDDITVRVGAFVLRDRARWWMMDFGSGFLSCA